VHLRDQLPAFSFRYVRRCIEKDFSKPVEELFESFDSTPVAAASIAQVHKATTLDGKSVAVKILRPRIARKFASDITLFYFIARLLGRFKKCRRLKLTEVVALFEQTVKKELDLRIEAAAASELKHNMRKDKGVYVPTIEWSLTSGRVLTLEWIDGIAIDDAKQLETAGHNREVLSEQLAISFFNQAYRDGFFHADTHPGNLFVDKEGRIVPIDFGIMGRLDKQTRLYVAQILRGFLTGDYEHVARVHFDAGYVDSDQSFGDFVLACRAIGEPIIGLPANQISVAKLLALLFKITEDFQMETQPQLLLLQKTMMLIEGLGQRLNPEVNMWQQAEPWIEKWGKENLSFEAQVKQGAKDIGAALLKLPERVKQLEALLDQCTNEKKQQVQTCHVKRCRWTGFWVTALGLVVLWGVFS
jgi:ubiquinone biosynthesis protein